MDETTPLPTLTPDAAPADPEVTDPEVDAAEVVDEQPDGAGDPDSARATLRSLWSPWTAVVGGLGLLLRVWVLQSREGFLHSDEAYTGLQAMGVLDGRFPVVVDGNRYGAVLESYLIALPQELTGPSDLLLKAIPITCWAIAAVLAYGAASYLAGRRAGAVAGALMWLTPGALLVISTRAYVGYASGMMVCTATLWAAAKLVDGPIDARRSALVGGLAGLAFYMHPMYLAAIVPICLPFLWSPHRTSPRFWVPFVGTGVAVNLPFLAWNAVNGWPSLEVQNEREGTYTDRLQAFGELLMPRALGLRDTRFDWILGRPLALFVYAVVVALVVVGAVALVRRGRRPSRWMVPLTVAGCWFVMALFSPLIFAEDGRYGVISFPFLVIAIAAAAQYLPDAVGLGRRAASASAVVLVGLWCLALVVPHSWRVLGSESVDADAPTDAVIDLLDERGFDRITGSYFAVIQIEYFTDREVTAAVLGGDAVRFPERQRTVESTPPEQVVFVFPPWAENEVFLRLPVEQYERLVVDGLVVYVPIAAS